MLNSKDGRQLVMMPHIEHSIFQWNWANYPEGRNDEVSLTLKKRPKLCLEAFSNTFAWLKGK